MRCARSRSWSTSNTTSTETPCASRWSWTLAAQRRQVSSRARRYCASWRKSARSSGRLDSPCSRSCSATRASWWKGASTSSSGLIRWRSCAEKPAARTELARKVMASKNGPRQSCARPRSPASSRRASRASGLVVDRVQPGDVLAARKEQGEQLAEVARRRRQRQQPGAQPDAELGPEAGARGEAEVGEQRRAVDLAQEQAQHLRGAPPVLVVALEHAEEEAQAQHRRRAPARLRVAPFERRAVQPLDQADHPEVALGDAGFRIGRVEQRRQVPGRGAGFRHGGARRRRALVQGGGERQAELADRRVERLRVLGHAEEGAAHRAVRRAPAASSWCTRSSRRA